MKPPFMKIAIVGAGLAARGTAHFLQELGEITLFDKGDLSPSRLAAGLLHKFVGFHAHKSPFSDEALPLSLSLIEPKTRTGLLRVAESEEQWRSFKKTAELYPDEVKIVSDRTIKIEEAWVVDCPAYLAALSYVKQEIASLNELSDFDLVILAGGAETLKLAPSLKLSPVRGQLLEVTGTPYPPIPMTGGAYLIPQKEKMIVGATYERGAPLLAEEVLLPKLSSLLPDFKLSEVIAVKGGSRASTPDRLPLIEQIDQKTWVFAGLGSKGLLYHAYFGKLLFEKVKNFTIRANSRKRE